MSLDGDTITSTGALNLTPATDSAIILDGAINVDAGVVTGATSITSTEFVGNVTGDVTGDVTGNVTGDVTGNVTGIVTGNVTGSAATVTSTAQSAITSVGTLTTLAVGNLSLDGNTITASSGALNLTPAAGSAKITIDDALTTITNADTTITGNLKVEGSHGGSAYSSAGIRSGAFAFDMPNINLGIDENSNQPHFYTQNTTHKTFYFREKDGGNGAKIDVGNITGDVTGNVTGDVTGNVTGDVTGDITGDVTGNVTGDVTGDVTGNANTATRIATITNSDIVQRSGTQTLTDKILTSPTITGTGNIAAAYIEIDRSSVGSFQRWGLKTGNMSVKRSMYLKSTGQGFGDPFEFSTNNSFQFRVDSTVAIHIQENAYVYFGNGHGTGSDDRVKTEEIQIENATDTLLKITPKNYYKHLSYRVDEEDEAPIPEKDLSGNVIKKHWESGVIAQDILVISELKHLISVRIDPETKDELLTMNYTGLIPFLIKSIQELNARIITLENKNNVD